MRRLCDDIKPYNWHERGKGYIKNVSRQYHSITTIDLGITTIEKKACAVLNDVDIVVALAKEIRFYCWHRPKSMCSVCTNRSRSE